jgi:hypothetical protein
MEMTDSRCNLRHPSSSSSLSNTSTINVQHIETAGGVVEKRRRRRKNEHATQKKKGVCICISRCARRVNVLLIIYMSIELSKLRRRG